MSRRRATYRPHASPTADELYRATYGHDLADLTIVPAPAEPNLWDHVGALVLAVGSGLFVIVAWLTGMWAMGLVR